jgi:hypothetical protein
LPSCFVPTAADQEEEGIFALLFCSCQRLYWAAGLLLQSKRAFAAGGSH